MRRTSQFVLLLVCILTLLACDKLTGSGAGSSSGSSSSSSSSSFSSGSIGVSECDDYIRSYRACLSDKVPADQRATLESALQTTESSWRQMAANPDQKAALAAACQEARESTANSLQAFGCSF
jgi:hypothetical protein